MPVVLMIREDDETHSVVLTAKPIVMGRSSSCDIKLSDDKISSRHLAIKLNKANRVIIKDLGSTNGTYLNGLKVDESYLMIADQLMIGAVSLWIDEGQLSLKERRILIRADAVAPVKFINLQGTSSSANIPSKPAEPAQAKIAKKAPEPLRPAPSNKKEVEELKNIEEVQEEKVFDDEDHGQEFHSSSREPSSSHQSLKDRIVNKTKNKKPSSPGVGIAVNKKEGQFDLEESSGATQMIKINKKGPQKSDKKVLIKKSKVKEKPKPESIVDKLKKILRLG